MRGKTFVASVSGAFAVMALWSPPAMQAGTIILEGSDAIGYHCAQENEASACTYEGQVWKALDGSSAEPIAVIGDIGNVSSQGSGVSRNSEGNVGCLLCYQYGAQVRLRWRRLRNS